MPEEGVELLPKAQILDFEELERLVGIFASVGVRRIRLTGGEPTIRKNVDALVARLAAVPGIDEIVMTTNGHRLAELAGPLRDAGLAGVNISIDSLDPDKFREITRRGDLARVLAGLDAALAVGLEVKLNIVALRGFNDGEVGDLCGFAWQRGVVPRFIEHMPMSDGMLYTESHRLTAADIRGAVAGAFGEDVQLEQPERRVTGPARTFRLVPSGRRFGIISAMTEHFCDTCNRVRLSSVGELHTCLAYDDATNLRDLLRGGATDQDVRDAIDAAVQGKRQGHVFEITGLGGPRKHMVSIGG
jgi:cyclic pyranopterin phosphate synthase